MESESKYLCVTSVNKEKEELLSIVAHDLKNPISAIVGLAEVLREEMLPESYGFKVLEQVGATAERMLALVKNLLNIAQIESGQLPLTFTECHLIPLVSNVLLLYQPAAAAKNITLHFDSTAAHPVVYGDEQALEQIIDNLISNAVKYSPHGKNVFVRISHSSFVIGHLSDENIPHPADKSANSPMTNSSMTNDQVTNAPMTIDQSTTGYVRVEVQDEGQGLSAEDMSKLFGKFARLTARPTAGEHSTGLGLSIVKKMVEAMNGQVWCESELGHGATFIVHLPQSTR